MTRRKERPRTLKFGDIKSTNVSNTLELKHVKETDAALILTGGPDNIGCLDGFRTISEDVYYEFEGPILGISYGFELLATVADPNCKLLPYQERSNTMFLPHPRAMEDTIFSKLPPGFLVSNRHSWSLSKVPKGYELMGETRGAHSVISAIKHEIRPIYGVQFHPELPVSGYWAGREIITGFVDMALPAPVLI